MSEKTRQQLSFFVSSTFVDLLPYREAARAGIVKIHRHVNDTVFYQRADSKAPEVLSIDEVKQSDYVILILAHRYGTIPPNETRSITEIEFDTAEEAGIPVLAFFAKDDYPWNPQFIEPDQLGKLREFKKKVAAKHVPAPFTTPESLELAVTEAVSALDKQYKPSSGWTPQPLYPISALDQMADLVVHIGSAEDGLPLVLQVSRSDNLNQPLVDLRKAIGALQQAGVAPHFDSILTTLKMQAEKEWQSRGISIVQFPSSRSERCYISRSNLTDLFSITLLATVLGDHREKPEEKIGTERLLRRSATGVMGKKKPDTRKRFLAVVVDKDRLEFAIVTREADQVTFWRELIPESLAGFSECEYELFREERIPLRGKFSNYVQSVSRARETLADLNGRPNAKIVFHISRHAIANVIWDLLLDLESRYHKSSIVHGDVKPRNCLVTAHGVRLIDPLTLAIGDFSPALSRSWAAPEQIAIRPVSKSTDIYPVGLMLAKLFQGELIGEIATYQLPLVSGTAQVSLVRDPYIWLGSDEPTLPDMGKKGWLQFVERCLRFNPDERYSSATDCAADLKELLDSYPPLGSVKVEIEREHFQVLQLPNGENALCRVLQDKPYGTAVSNSMTIAEPTCPKCRNPYLPGTPFCNNCGATLV